MRIIFFNIWHGFVWDKLENFVLDQTKKTDIFNFIEVDPDVQLKLQKILSDYNFLYNKGGLIKFHGGIYEGQSVFFKKRIQVIQNQKIRTYKPTDTDADEFLVTRFKSVDSKEFVLGSVHGTARPGSKLDTEERIIQSETIIDSVQKYDLPKIIGGDFNLLPETESIKMFEKAGYRNLIKDFKIASTRNQLCWDQFPEEIKENGKQYFADYCFVSSEIKVENFEVPLLEASDHEPLILDFQI